MQVVSTHPHAPIPVIPVPPLSKEGRASVLALFPCLPHLPLRAASWAAWTWPFPHDVPCLCTPIPPTRADPSQRCVRRAFRPVTPRPSAPSRLASPSLPLRAGPSLSWCSSLCVGEWHQTCVSLPRALSPSDEDGGHAQSGVAGAGPVILMRVCTSVRVCMVSISWVVSGVVSLYFLLLSLRVRGSVLLGLARQVEWRCLCEQYTSLGLDSVAVRLHRNVSLCGRSAGARTGATGAGTARARPCRPCVQGGQRVIRERD